MNETLGRRYLETLLSAVADGETSVPEALGRMEAWPEDDMDFARFDTQRALRQGMLEAVFAEGKTSAQVIAILERSLASHGAAFATRVSVAMAAEVLERLPQLQHSPSGRTLRYREEDSEGIGDVLVVSAGTADQPVVDEAMETLRFLGSRVERVADIGVSGVHRLIRRLPRLRAAKVLVVVAGMEGALPSVVAGAVANPVIAVPTSVGYGANLGGVTAMLAMMNSCAPGVSVVNIDNGYGAACQAHLINRLASEAPGEPGDGPI
jgi:pyridinium-3,5-biscarboxylic acid mononucleotide synthase